MACVLGIETATPLLSVAIVGPEGLRAERAAFGERLHSVRLFPFIEELLRDAGTHLEDLNGIAVSQGPGSFTGLRLGVVTAKTLAQVCTLPVIGIPTLLALAAPLLSGGIPVCPVIISRSDEVYAAAYAAADPEATLLVAPFAAPPAEAAQKFASLAKLLLTGEGAWAFREVFTEILGERALFAPKVFNYPRATTVAFLGRQKLARGAAVTPFDLLPEYLRLPAIKGRRGT